MKSQRLGILNYNWKKKNLLDDDTEPLAPVFTLSIQRSNLRCDRLLQTEMLTCLRADMQNNYVSTAACGSLLLLSCLRRKRNHSPFIFSVSSHQQTHTHRHTSCSLASSGFRSCDCVWGKVGRGQGKVSSSKAAVASGHLDNFELQTHEPCHITGFLHARLETPPMHYYTSWTQSCAQVYAQPHLQGSGQNKDVLFGWMDGTKTGHDLPIWKHPRHTPKQKDMGKKKKKKCILD